MDAEEIGVEEVKSTLEEMDEDDLLAVIAAAVIELDGRESGTYAERYAALREAFEEAEDENALNELVILLQEHEDD